MKRAFVLVVVMLIASSAFSQMNWYGKKAVSSNKWATSTKWDTTWLNPNFSDVWKGWIYNTSTDTIRYCTDMDTANASYLYPGEMEEGVLMYGKMFNVKSDSSSSKYRFKFN